MSQLKIYDAEVKAEKSTYKIRNVVSYEISSIGMLTLTKANGSILVFSTFFELALSKH